VKKDDRETDEAGEGRTADDDSVESDSPESDSPDSDTDLLRKVVVGTAGGVVTAAGVVMLVTPGPGIIVTLGGLSILGSDFPIARKTLNGIRKRLR